MDRARFLPDAPVVSFEDEPEGKDLGFMEFFDWLAGTSDKELRMLAKEYDVDCGMASPIPAWKREKAGLKIWEHL